MSNRINIEASLYLSTKDFELVGEVEYDKFGEGYCCEGHPIKYGIELSDGEGKIFVYGNTCVYKPYVFKHWNVKPEELENPDLMKAGRYLWIISRDNLIDFIDEIPHPKDYEYDYSKLYKELSLIILNAKKEKRKRQRELKKDFLMKQKIEKFRKSHKHQHNLILKLIGVVKKLKDNNRLTILNEWERSFIKSIIGQHRDLKQLTEKQLDIINRIVSIGDNIDKNRISDTEIAKKMTKAIENIENLNSSNREFILSIQRYFFKNGTLSKKQLQVLNNIINSDKDKYIGSIMSEWITGKKCDFEGEQGIIISVEKTTPKAVLCTFEVRDMKFKDWVPKSHIQLKDSK